MNVRAQVISLGIVTPYLASTPTSAQGAIFNDKEAVSRVASSQDGSPDC